MAFTIKGLVSDGTLPTSAKSDLAADLSNGSSTVGQAAATKFAAKTELTDYAKKTDLAGIGSGAVDRGQKFMAKLEHGTDDANVYLMGDSTGNENIEWFRLGVNALMAQYPGFSADYRLWSDTTKSYAAPVTIQTANTTPVNAVTFSDSFNRTATDIIGTTPETGAAWTRSASNSNGNWSLDGSKAVRQVTAASDAVLANSGATGDQTVTASGVTLSTVGGSSQKSFRVLGKYVDASNHLLIDIGVSTSGFPSVLLSKRIGGTATTITSISSGIPASTEGNVFNVVLKLEGLTVTATVNGVTVTGTLTQVEADALAPATQAGLYGSVAAAGTSVDAFQVETLGTSGAAAKTVHFYNGSHPGSSLNYQRDNFAALFPATPDVVLISSAHNYGGHEPVTYLPFVRDFVAQVEAAFPGASGFVVGSQNTRFAPASLNDVYYRRLTALRAEALARGWGYLPVVEAFRARPDKGQSYVKSDGVHPTTSVDAPNPDNGSSLWSRVFLDYMSRLKQPVVS